MRAHAISDRNYFHTNKLSDTDTDTNTSTNTQTNTYTHTHTYGNHIVIFFLKYHRPYKMHVRIISQIEILILYAAFMYVCRDSDLHTKIEQTLFFHPVFYHYLCFLSLLHKFLCTLCVLNTVCVYHLHRARKIIKFESHQILIYRYYMPFHISFQDRLYTDMRNKREIESLHYSKHFYSPILFSSLLLLSSFYFIQTQILYC